MKAIVIERDLEFHRTHSIRELVGQLEDQGIIVNISDDEVDLMDTIYLPSKYPIYSVLPHASPDLEICRSALKIVEKVKASISVCLEERPKDL